MKFQNLIESKFAERLVNLFPGTFYVYEKVGDQILLKWWNNGHVKIIGYSDKELLNMPGSTFFTEKEYKKVEKGLEEVFINGTAQIQVKVLTKSGKQVTHLLEAFSFVDKNRHYLMGVGVDITSQLRVEKNLYKSVIEQEKLVQEKGEIIQQLETKKRELITIAVESGKTNKIIKSTLNQLNKLIENHSQNELYQELVTIRRNLEIQMKTEDNWEIFKLRFIEVHRGFFDNLNKKHPGLTNTELKFCAYLHINLSSEQIGSILNVSPYAIKKTRYRIRKKLGLKTKDSLEESITNL